MRSMRFYSNARKKYITHIVKINYRLSNEMIKYMYLHLTGYRKSQSADVVEDILPQPPLEVDVPITIV